MHSLRAELLSDCVPTAETSDTLAAVGSAEAVSIQVESLSRQRLAYDTMIESPKDKAAQYRKMAAECLEVADRMSLKADRERMTEMAIRWLDMAQKAEAEPEPGAC